MGGWMDSIGGFLSDTMDTVGSLADTVGGAADSLAGIGVNFGSTSTAAGAGGFQGTIPGVGNSFNAYAPSMGPPMGDPGGSGFSATSLIWPAAAVGIAYLVLKK
tara:strand:+ start:1269 stop:1580 length:312 start_codon:yes stop_codon:yes gene_type:complete